MYCSFERRFWGFARGLVRNLFLRSEFGCFWRDEVGLDEGYDCKNRGMRFVGKCENLLEVFLTED